MRKYMRSGITGILSSAGSWAAASWGSDASVSPSREGRFGLFVVIIVLHIPTAVAVVQVVLEHLGGPEGEHPARRDLHRLPGLRVTPHAGAFLAHHEISEAGDLDFLSLRK